MDEFIFIHSFYINFFIFYYLLKYLGFFHNKTYQIIRFFNLFWVIMYQ